MTTRNLEEELERLKKENDALRKEQTKGAFALKVSVKGAVSVYGFGRFPVTLYMSQWQKIFEMQDEIKAFIIENSDKLEKPNTGSRSGSGC